MKKILTLFILLALVQLTAVGQTMRERAELNMAAQKIGATLMAIKGFYIDTVNTVKLADEAIKGMLSQLDPHSSYSNAEETKRFTEPLNSNFEGIGVQFNVLNDTLVVIQPVSKGPSEKAGILAGDRIIIVNDSAFDYVNWGFHAPCSFFACFMHSPHKATPNLPRLNFAMLSTCHVEPSRFRTGAI